ncbi:MAG: HAD family hydrolase [Streptococcaceae bacterium]|nr:HAD family hydrolase [Streptococcaceae bacterium]
MTNHLKLFATDMDGTLLDSTDRDYNHDQLREILNIFKKKGLIFCAASGRQLLALEDLFNEFQDQVAFVAENGAIVKYQGQILYSNFLGKEKAELIHQTVQTSPHHLNGFILFSAINGSYVLDTCEPELIDYARLYYKKLTIIHSIDDIKEDILKVCVEFPPDKIHECEAWLNERVAGIRATTTGFRSIDIMNAGISKATGLTHLLSHFNWTAENLVAFGDQMNDLEMLQFAGKSIAVSNAVEQIKAVSDIQIGSNNENSVLLEIEKLIK